MEAKNTTASLRENERIIRQSQMERSIELFQLFEVKPTLREVLRLSQLLTNFQYDWNVNNYELMKFENHFKQVADSKLMESIPHINVDKPTRQNDSSVSDYQLSVGKKLKGR
jgi:hypothetical protein